MAKSCKIFEKWAYFSRKNLKNGYPFLPKSLLKMGRGFEARAAHPCPTQIWVPSGEIGTSLIPWHLQWLLPSNYVCNLKGRPENFWLFSWFQQFLLLQFVLSFIFSPIWAILPWFQVIFQLFRAFSVFLTKEHFQVWKGFSFYMTRTSRYIPTTTTKLIFKIPVTSQFCKIASEA